MKRLKKKIAIWTALFWMTIICWSLSHKYDAEWWITIPLCVLGVFAFTKVTEYYESIGYRKSMIDAGWKVMDE